MFSAVQVKLRNSNGTPLPDKSCSQRRSRSRPAGKRLVISGNQQVSSLTAAPHREVQQIPFSSTDVLDTALAPVVDRAPSFPPKMVSILSIGNSPPHFPFVFAKPHSPKRSLELTNAAGARPWRDSYGPNAPEWKTPERSLTAVMAATDCDAKREEGDWVWRYPAKISP
jgi:hypothetical protein